MNHKYLMKPAILCPQVYFVHDDGWNWIQDLGNSNVHFIGGKEGIGKKSLAYEYAYQNRNKYKNIYMVHFKENWFETWSHYMGIFPKNEEEYLEMCSAVIQQLENSLLIVYDYVSSQENREIASLFNQKHIDTIYVTSKKSGYDLEGLDYLIAYKLFDYYYDGDASSEREGVYRLIKKVNGNPSMMCLFAVVANLYYHEGYRIPIEHLNQELKQPHPKYHVMKDKHEFDPIIHCLLKNFDLTEEEKELITMFYFTHDLKIKHSTILKAGIHEETIQRLIKNQFFLNVDDMIILNKLFKKELYEKVIGKNKKLTDKFVEMLHTCANTNLKYSFLLKVTPDDPLLSKALECIDENKAYEVESSLLEECILVLKEHEFPHSINISTLEKILLEKKLDIDSLTKYIIKSKTEGTFKQLLNELKNQE